MKPLSIVVRAFWDDEVEVWVASTTDIHGLAAEAETMEALKAKVLPMLEDLIEDNGYESEHGVHMGQLPLMTFETCPQS